MLNRLAQGSSQSDRFKSVRLDVEMSFLSTADDELRASGFPRQVSPIEPTVKLFQLPERKVTL